MSRRPVRNFNLNVYIVLNKATIFEYYLDSLYINKFAYLYSIAGSNYLRLSKFQTTKGFGYLVECN